MFFLFLFSRTLHAFSSASWFLFFATRSRETSLSRCPLIFQFLSLYFGGMQHWVIVLFLCYHGYRGKVWKWKHQSFWEEGSKTSTTHNHIKICEVWQSRGREHCVWHRSIFKTLTRCHSISPLESWNQPQNSPAWDNFSGLSRAGTSYVQGAHVQKYFVRESPWWSIS